MSGHEEQEEQEEQSSEEYVNSYEYVINVESLTINANIVHLQTGGNPTSNPPPPLPPPLGNT